MMNIKNIILDLGGVLINLDYDKLDKSLSSLGLSNAFSKAKQIEIFDKLEEGKISQKDFFSEFNRLAEANHDNQTIINTWNSIILDFPKERLELIELLKKNIVCFCLVIQIQFISKLFTIFLTRIIVLKTSINILKKYIYLMN